MSDFSNDKIIKITNPVLAAKLNSGKVELPNSNKIKKPAPPIADRFIDKISSEAINPRRIKPSIPGRLKGFFDDQAKPLDKLTAALDIDGQESLEIVSKNPESLFEKSFYFLSPLSLVQLLELDEEFFVNDSHSDSLDKLDSMLETIDNPELKEFYSAILEQSLQLAPDQRYMPVLQFFLPLPFAFVFAEPDEEFEMEQEELYEEDDSGFFNDEDSADEDSEEEQEDNKNQKTASLTMSVKTINFNKILFVIKHNPKTKKLKLAIKGSPEATELAIPIEANLEDALYGVVNDIDYLLRLWRENVIRVTETRILKVSSTGALDPIILRACNSILKTIYESDINLDDSSMLEADYNII